MTPVCPSRRRASSGHRRTAPALLGILGATLLATGCGASSPTTSASPSATSSEGVRQLHLVVSGSAVTGDTGTVVVRLGQPLRLTVTSDVADEVHVHGADVSAQVAAGGTVVLDVVEQAPGRFEVELEKSKRVLTRLQVR